MSDDHVGWSVRLCNRFCVYRPRRLGHGAPIHGLGIREIRMQLANCRPRIRRWNSIERDAVVTFLPGRKGMGPARISGPRLPVARVAAGTNEET